MSAVSLRAAYAAIPILALLTGVIAAVVGTAAADKPMLILGPPLALALFFIMLLDRKKLLITILAFRSSSDIVFSTARFDLGGYAIGVGGLINVFVVLLALLLVMEKASTLPKRMVTVWLGFLALGLIGVVRSPVIAEAIRLYLSQLSYFAVFVSAFYVVRTADDFRFAVKVVLWSSVLPAIYVLVEIATGGGIRHDGFRAQSTLGHPNIFAFYLTLVIALVLYMLKSPVKLTQAKRVGLTAYMLYLLVLLVLTQTRSAWIACFLMFALYGWFFEKRYLIYVTLVPLLALLIPSVQDRLVELSVGNEYVGSAKLNSFGWRRLIWESSLQWMEKSHYLFGYGLDSFRFHSVIFFPIAYSVQAGAHNVYVQMLFELGTLGLLAWLWLYGKLLWVLRQMAGVDRLGAFVSISLVIGYLVVSIADNMLGYLAFNWYFWFVVGAACSLTLASVESKPGTRPQMAVAPRHASA